MTKEELLTKKVAMISLGCDKNTVDAERMMFLLKTYGFDFTNDISNAQIAIVNTCAFILPSKKESIEKILEVCSYKAQNLEKVIVTGCLPQRYYDEVEQSIPEIDALVRIKNNDRIVDIICGLYGVFDNTKIKEKQPNRLLSTPKHYAFLKISDGCNNFCSYCTIPFIRGRYKSTPIECIVDEAKALVSSGVKELILVAQDVSNYGADLYGKPKLVELIRELSKIKDLRWIRLHYCYPKLITDELLNEIVNNDKVCKYLDIPLQHISSKILKNMNRKETAEDIKALLNKIKALPKEIAIRSTFIVGFPGETIKDFIELCNFLKEYKLDNVGFFTYSREYNTRAYKLPHQVFEFVKKIRLKIVQKIQEKVLYTNQSQKIGKVLNVICEDVKQLENNQLLYTFRDEYNSVDVDTLIYVQTDETLNLGDFHKIEIIGQTGLDLIGKIVKEI